MTQMDVLRALADGKISVDTRGHVFPDRAFSGVAESFLSLLEEDEMISIDYLVREVPGGFSVKVEGSCVHCGKRVWSLLVSEGEDGLVGVVEGGVKNESGRIVRGVLPSCEANFTEYSFDLKVGAEPMVFANYFLKDGDYIEPDDLEFQISYKSGRKKLSEFYAGKGMLYVQTGNLTAYLLRKDDSFVLMSWKPSEALAEADEYDFSKEELEAFHRYADWEMVGSVGCEVWRVMAAPKSVVEELGLEAVEHYSGPFELAMTPGTYRVTVNEDWESESPVLARLEKL